MAMNDTIWPNDDTIINIFNDIKIFSVNASDNHIKKLELLAKDGKIAINLIGNMGEFQLKLYSSEFENSQERIFLKKNLKEIDFCFKNDNISKKIELKIINEINKIYYAIDFLKEEDYKEFQKYLDNLKEISCESNKVSSKISAFMTEDQEMIDLTDDDGFETVTPKGIFLAKI